MKIHIINSKKYYEPEKSETIDEIDVEMHVKCFVSDCVRLNCSRCIFSKESKEEYILLYKNKQPNKEFTNSDEDY